MKQMVEFETIGESTTIQLENGTFIEISIKSAATENKSINYCSIASGEFYLDVGGQNAKRYRKSISVPINKINKVAEALKALPK